MRELEMREAERLCKFTLASTVCALVIAAFTGRRDYV